VLFILCICWECGWHALLPDRRSDRLVSLQQSGGAELVIRLDGLSPYHESVESS
jgi:hypothetical protein